MYTNNLLTDNTEYEFMTFGENEYPIRKEEVPFNIKHNTIINLYNPNPLPILEISKIGTVELCEGLNIDVYGDVMDTWFLGSDIAKMLDYKQFPDGSYDVNAMIRQLDSRFVQTFKIVNQDTSTTISGRSLMGNPNRLFINETGLYIKLGNSRKQQAQNYMIMISDTLMSIRQRVGQLAFNSSTFDRYEKINNLFIDSRISRNKIKEYIYEELGIVFENDFEFFKFLEDANFVKLNDKNLIIDYNKKLIHCIKNDFGDGNIFYIPDQFKYDGVIKMDQYISSLSYNK